MRKLIILFLYLNIVLIGGCSLHPYQPDIQQGNLISSSAKEQIKVGMSKQQVENILGEPVLSPTADNNRRVYVYTFQHNGGEIVRKKLNVYFRNNRVSHISMSDGKIN